MVTGEFKKVIKDTLEHLPEEFKSQLDNLEITVEEMPEGNEFEERDDDTGILLGLYTGVPKNERFSYSALPDKITIYKKPILSIAKKEADAKRIIRDTVLHELGHHFGLSDEELDKIKNI